MANVNHVALVSEVDGLDLGEVMKVAAALQRQVTIDAAPIWNLSATVAAFRTLKDVPLGYWPIIVRQDIAQPGAAGVHEDQGGQPFALVEYGPTWSLTASHELLEMLVDPSGNRVEAGPSPRADQGTVEFLVEVCDPCEAANFAYLINGVLVSDFYTPSYLDAERVPGVRYSFRNVSVHRPDCLIQPAVQYFNMFAGLHDVEGGLTLADCGT
jgi:hypothetical protein